MVECMKTEGSLHVYLCCDSRQEIISLLIERVMSRKKRNDILLPAPLEIKFPMEN